VAGIVFGCTFGASVLGTIVRRRLPEHHVTGDSKDSLKMGLGLIATLSALVLGLLVASAKSSFDGQKAGVQQLATDAIMLDRVLANYGPGSQVAREKLRAAVDLLLAHLWSERGFHAAGLDSPQLSAGGVELGAALRDLPEATDNQKAMKSQAISTALDMAKTRWTLGQQGDGSIPVPFLVVLVFWLAVLFASFGLFAPRNATLVVGLFVCALSVAGALFLIVEMDQPFSGLIVIPDAPLRTILPKLGK
jgi:hypothetical protein